MKQDTLGDLCKWFEKNCSPEIMMPLIPTIIRFDGLDSQNGLKD